MKGIIVVAKKNQVANNNSGNDFSANNIYMLLEFEQASN
jgi:hypothetical protein